MRRFILSAAVVFGALGLWLAMASRPGDPALYPARDAGIEVTLVSNGYHAGLLLPRQALGEVAAQNGMASLIAVTSRFRSFSGIEFGWGDAEFYRATPTADSFEWGLAAKALLGLGASSAVHVVGVAGPPEEVFANASRVSIRLSADGFQRLAQRVERSFARQPSGLVEELGPGLYGPSLFYRSDDPFHLFRVCNHWIADLLDAAGVPTNTALSLLPVGLLADLRWRSGLPASR